MTRIAPSGAGTVLWDRRPVLGWLIALAGLPFLRPARADGAVVEMRQIQFMPAEIEIVAGGAVTFVNADLVPHTATANDKSFDTGLLRKGERKELTFPKAGEFPYACKFHPHMTGRIVVR
ncbi:MAG TPA: cupredoxin family copper-binding protein [Dongiaceae bacterium]|nr:cupredoxin family copper-binding protein [Dongiaceae bacterium]